MDGSPLTINQGADQLWDSEGRTLDGRFALRVETEWTAVRSGDSPGGAGTRNSSITPS
jgi:hypothetical protein